MRLFGEKILLLDSESKIGKVKNILLINRHLLNQIV